MTRSRSPAPQPPSAPNAYSAARTACSRAPAAAPDAQTHADFLRAQLPKQPAGVTRHRLGGERVWLKKAGPRHGRLRYQLLAALAALLRLDLLKPVPNPGGTAAIAIEARRLQQLAALGLRVPQLLAHEPDGLLIADLGEGGRAPLVLNERLEQAAAAGPTALLAAWREGLDAIAGAHARGAYLSQAFARNLMHCPDGEIGFIDFEDDPGARLPLLECHARDWLAYLHSTALLLTATAPQAAGAHWHAVMADASAPVRERLALAARRMRWLRHLPADRRWGRDTQRVRAVGLLLTRWYDATEMLATTPSGRDVL